MSSIPRDASSVILVRPDPAEPAREQALLIRRGAQLFAGGTWAFPGGKVEPSDGSAATLRTLGLADSGESASLLGLKIASCRETFEEVGVVLAYHGDGTPCDAALQEKLRPMRGEIAANPGRFAALLADHGLAIDPSRLIYWSHWIAPSLLEKRFDTRFFVAIMPPGQIVHADSDEATELLWLDLGKHGALPEESVVHAPPTRFSLGDLTLSLDHHGGIEALMDAERARKVEAMMPKAVRIDGQINALMPWDSEYGSSPGEGIAPDAEISAIYRGFPSRVRLPKNIRGMPS
jgi:8-oxo-dGTP pyrophosphatase MutT (NUDIX family)